MTPKQQECKKTLLTIQIQIAYAASLTNQTQLYQRVCPEPAKPSKWSKVTPPWGWGSGDETNHGQNYHVTLLSIMWLHLQNLMQWRYEMVTCLDGNAVSLFLYILDIVHFDGNPSGSPSKNLVWSTKLQCSSLGSHNFFSFSTATRWGHAHNDALRYRYAENYMEY